MAIKPLIGRWGQGFIMQQQRLLLQQPFTPADLPGLAAWYKADAGITTVSSAVSVWADQSGNGRDVTQGVAANRPAYGSETLNGIDVLTFDGSDWLNAAAVSTFNFLHQGDSTVFVVARTGNVANPDASYSFIGSNGTSPIFTGIVLIYDDRSILSRNNALLYQCTASIAGSYVARGLDNDKITPNAWKRLGVATDVDLPFADRLHGFVDGVIYSATVDTGTATSPSAGDASYALQIGAAGNNLVPYLGAMAEVIMYSRKLSATEIGQVDDYLKAKWAL